MSLKKLPLIQPVNFKLPDNRIDQRILSRWPLDVKSADDDEETITIYEEIGQNFWGDGFTAKKMAAILRNIGKEKDVVVSINSPGGEVFEGLTIYNMLAEHKGKVTVKIPGIAASIAGIIAMAGDEIKIAEAGFIMIHNAWGFVMGNRHDFTEAAETFAKFDASLVDIMAARTGNPKEEIASMMDKDTFLSGKEAVEMGFATELLPNKAVKSGDDDEKKAKALARRTIEAALAKEGISRKDREEVLKKAFGVCDTASVAARDAGYKQQLTELLKSIREG